jgi:hypothetical protein
MKTTVLKDGPGTILDRKARLHRALDAALDKKAAKDGLPAAVLADIQRMAPAKLRATAEAYEERAKQYAAPALKKECKEVAMACRAALAKALDEYKFAEPSKKPKPIVTFLDRYMQTKAEAAKGKDASMEKKFTSERAARTWAEQQRTGETYWIFVDEDNLSRVVVVNEQVQPEFGFRIAQPPVHTSSRAKDLAPV